MCVRQLRSRAKTRFRNLKELKNVPTASSSFRRANGDSTSRSASSTPNGRSRSSRSLKDRRMQPMRALMTSLRTCVALQASAPTSSVASKKLSRNKTNLRQIARAILLRRLFKAATRRPRLLKLPKALMEAKLSGMASHRASRARLPTS